MAAKLHWASRRERVREMCRYLALIVGVFALLLAGPARGQAPQGGKPPSGEVIPGLPPLPPGVELPDDVKAFLKKALQEGNKGKGSNANSPATKRPAPAKKATAKSAASLRPRASASTAFRRTASETPLGSIGALDLSKVERYNPKFWVSPDGRRFACLTAEGIMIDGQEYRYRRPIEGKTFRFSPDSKHTVFVANVLGVDNQTESLVFDGKAEERGWNFISHEGAVFSPDSQHVAYIARRYAKGDVEYVLMIDGKEREVFKESPAWSLCFSPDNRRVVWGESVAGKYAMRETSVDGSEPRVERQHGPALLTMNFFFGGSGQLGYIAKDEEGKFFVVYDGQEHPLRFKELKSALLSEDGKHMAYAAEPETFRRVVVKDGQASKSYGGFDGDYVKDSLVLSPDGKRWAYAIKKRNEHFAVIDGKESKPYRAVTGFSFSPDGRRLAYRALLGNKLVMVVDGREMGSYEELGVAVFSSDGTSVAFAAADRQQKFVVLNGQAQLPYTDVGSLAFGPPANRLVYQGELESDGEWVLNEGGREGKPYEVLVDTFFSPSGQRTATVAYESSGQLVVVDGVEGAHYDTIVTLAGGRVQFTDEDHFFYLAARQGVMYLVDEAIAR